MVTDWVELYLPPGGKNVGPSASGRFTFAASLNTTPQPKPPHSPPTTPPCVVVPNKLPPGPSAKPAFGAQSSPVPEKLYSTVALPAAATSKTLPHPRFSEPISPVDTVQPPAPPCAVVP